MVQLHRFMLLVLRQLSKEDSIIDVSRAYELIGSIPDASKRLSPCAPLGPTEVVFITRVSPFGPCWPATCVQSCFGFGVRSTLRPADGIQCWIAG